MTELPESLNELILHSSLLRWILILLTLGLSMVAVDSAIDGLYDEAGQIAAMASVFATILLVSLTSQYAAQTRELVEESKQAREQEQQSREHDRQREVDTLRRGLLNEISSIENIDQFSDQYEVSHSIYEFGAPTTIYEQNADKIGLLTENEIEHVIEYYGRLNKIKKLIDVQRKVDTTVGMDYITEILKRCEALFDFVLWKVSFGRFGQRNSKIRERHIKEKIGELADVQREAIDSLEEELD